MADSFETQLARVTGTIHRVYIDDHHHRMQNGMLYYWNKADDLRKSTEILMANGAPRDNSSMLAGMATEVLLKGIACALDNPASNTHHLRKLADHVGIELTDDEKVLLDVMSEHIIWAGRYTAPKHETDWQKVWELQDKQRRKSGSLVDFENPSRTVAVGTFRQLWAKFASSFHQAHQSRFESAEFKGE